MGYLIFKALHIIAIIAWMAGILYLPRLFVYHAGVKTESEMSTVFKIMEYRLLKIIMNPALIASWIFGVILYINGSGYLITNGWFYVKIMFVCLLTTYHMFLARYVRIFGQNKNTHGVKFYKIINEIPSIAIIVIVFLAVVKPF